MTVLVVFALEWEFIPWRQARPFRRLEASAGAYEARIGHTRVVVGFVGVGARRLANLTPIFMPDVAACVSTGLAGGLVPDHRVGDLVVARQVRAGTGGAIIEADARLAHVAEACGARRVARFVTSTHVVSRAEEKMRLSALADVVDMEGAAILREATHRGVPGIAVRVIGDASDETLPIDFNRALAADGGVSIPRIAALLCRQPWAVPSLIRFGARNRAATERLATFLDDYVQRLASDPGRP